MLSNQIQAWFDSKGSYNDGVRLYEICGGTVPLRELQAGSSMQFVPSNLRQKLEDQLRNYLIKVPPMAGISPQYLVHSPQELSTANSQQLTAPTIEPEAILNLRSKAKLLHKEQALKHAQLATVTTDKERYALAFQIMEEVIPQLDNIYDTIREWESTGELPAPVHTNDVIKDTVEKMKKVYSLSPRISRLKKWLNGGKKLTNKERQDYEKELLEKELELKDLRAELGLDT